jgi:hypothetical protein
VAGVSNGNSGDFLLSNNTCNVGTVLLPAASCTVDVAFKPGNSGTRSTTLTFTGASGSATTTQTTSLTGTGQAASATLTGTAAFGGVTVGATSPANSFTYTNTGIGPITVSTVTLSSTTDFAIVSDSCIVAGTGITLAPNGTCLIGVTFMPTSAGAHTATLVVNDAAGGAAASSVTLNGNGQSFTATLTGTTAFGNKQVATTSAARTFTYTNTGNTATTVSSVALSSTADFAISANTCTALLAPNATCSIGVTFTPSSAIALTATLTVTNAANVAASVSLTGTGVVPSASLTGTAAFGNQQLGTTSTVHAFTFTNTGTATVYGPFSVTTASVSGTNAADFVIGTNNCTTLQLNGTCTVNVTFKPSAPGTRTAILTLTGTSGSASTSLTSSLSGTGVQAVVSVTPTILTVPTLNFGTTVGVTTRTATITNTGPAGSQLSNISASIGAGSSAQFTITGGNCTGATLAQNGTCTVIVTRNRTSAGIGTLAITYAGATTTSQTVFLTGN